jgi:predicted nucleic-acid-binding protein
MIAVDTNILVRHLTEDDPAQLKMVHKLFRAHQEEGLIFISLVVLLELHWVLEDCYHWECTKFCDCIEDILRVSQFHIEHPAVVKSAISRYRKNQDFSDALIGQIAAAKGAQTYTFDKSLKKDSAFIILE